MFEYTLLNDNISNDDTFYFRLQEDRVDLVKVDVTNLKELAMSRRIVDPLPATIAMIQGQELGLAMAGLLDDQKVKTLVNFMLSLDPKDWNFSVNYSIVEYDLALSKGSLDSE